MDEQTAVFRDERIEIVVLLDRSGSMQQGRSDHEGGLRSFVADQQRLTGEVRFTFIRFDDVEPFELVLNRVLLADVQPETLELIPRGRTPLLDAVGKTIEYMDGELLGEQLDQRVLLIITDGQENASQKFTRETVQKLTAAWQSRLGGRVLYLGANVDEFAEAGVLGVSQSTALRYAATEVGISAAYNLVSAKLRDTRAIWRATGNVAANAYDFTDEERQAAADLGSGAPASPNPSADADPKDRFAKWETRTR